MAKEIKELSDEELVEEIGKTPNVLKSRYYQAELTRRLMDELRKFNRSSSEYSKMLLIFNVVLIIIGFTQVVVSIASGSGHWLVNGIFIFFFTMMILFYWKHLWHFMGK